MIFGSIDWHGYHHSCNRLLLMVKDGYPDGIDIEVKLSKSKGNPFAPYLFKSLL